MIRILIADNDTLMRAGIRSLLAGRPDIQIVGEARGSPETLEIIRQCQPDVVLMDIRMPMMDGMEVTALAKAQFPDVRILILSLSSDEEHILRALRAGAAGYIVKDVGASELETAIRSVARGESYVCASASQVLMDYVRRTLRDPQPLVRLTRRQREVLQLIADGKKTKEIGRILGISPKTVETHRTRLMDELDLHDVAALVRFAIRAGVIEPHK